MSNHTTDLSEIEALQKTIESIAGRELEAFERGRLQGMQQERALKQVESESQWIELTGQLNERCEAAEKLAAERLEQMQADRSQALAWSDAMEKDAARYRWLRDHSEPGLCWFYLSVGKAFDGVKFESQAVDETIDAQIATIAKGGK